MGSEPIAFRIVFGSSNLPRCRIDLSVILEQLLVLGRLSTREMMPDRPDDCVALSGGLRSEVWSYD